MNQLQLDSTAIGTAEIASASVIHADITTCSSDSLSSSFLSADKIEIYNRVAFGNRTFDVEELGTLLQYLLDTHPELKI